MTAIEGVEDISGRANQWYDPNVVDALRELHGLNPLEVQDRPDVPRRITALRVLRTNTAFSSLIAAIGISSLGDPLTQVAALVWIYLKTHDPVLVALAFIVQAFATILMTTLVGGITDRLPRRSLIVGLEVFRALVLFATPFLVDPWWYLIVPVLFVTSSVNAVVQPAKQAAIPSLVPAGQVGKANAIVAATTMLTGAVGFGVAAAYLTGFSSPADGKWLFVGDGLTFLLAAGIIVGLPNLGGGSTTTRVSGTIRRSWSIVEARPYLAISTLAAFLIPISFPALLSLAYGLSSNGSRAYSMLELISSIAIFVGSMVVSRLTAIGSLRTVGAGLILTGAFSVAMAMSHNFWIVAVALFIASIGNPIYSVATQTALLEAANTTNRGSIMATRFGLAQTAGIVGMAVGGLITAVSGAGAAYAVLGVGLVVLALYAIAAGGSTTSALRGTAYDEAALQQAKT
jgi:MFS family permease